MNPFEREFRAARARFLEREAAALESEEDFSQRLIFSFLTGVYVAINAVRDARLVVEGPDCTYMKAQYLQGNHDLFADLTHVSGYHRVVNTALHPTMMIESREEAVRAQMSQVAAHEGTGALFVTAMPMAQVTGADYEGLADEVMAESGTPVINVRGLSLQGDWLDGYAETLRALARQIALPERAGEPDPRKVAIVGYLYDRNELDHRANLAELRRIVEGLGAELVSVWLAGRRFEELPAVAEAGTIVSMPYGRLAARKLARRTGARLLELELPFGLPATERWTRALGEALGAAEAAEALIDRCLGEVVPRLEWLIPQVFQNTAAGYIGDPHLLPGFAESLELLGARLAFAVLTNQPKHARELGDLRARFPTLVYPHRRRFMYFTAERLHAERVHLVVTNHVGHGIYTRRAAFYELGFPGLYRHALHDEPFLGFAGFGALAGALANTLRAKEVELARQESLWKLVDDMDRKDMSRKDMNAAGDD